MPPGIYLQLDVDFASNKDVAPIRRFGRDTAAIRDLLVQCWCYCKRHMSDGHVPLEELGLLVYPDAPKVAVKRADCLVEAGIAVRTDEGYFFPGFLKRNKSRAQIAADSAERAARGKKGGERSGEVRRAQAEAKQAASTTANTETETETEPQAEPEAEPETSFNSESGNRQVTLHAVPATEHPPTTPTEARCTGHRGVADPGPCKGCRAEREHAERLVRADTEAEARRLEAAARACTACDGVRVIDDEGRPTRRKCDHTRRTA